MTGNILDRIFGRKHKWVRDDALLAIQCVACRTFGCYFCKNPKRGCRP